MTDKGQLVRISPVISANERAKAIEFIERKMRETFECDPPDTHGLILGAYSSEAIVGSIVLISPALNEPFGLEGRYDFGEENSLSSRRHEIVEGSRWLASVPGASLLLLEAAAQVAVNLAKNYMLIEAKEYSVKRLRELGANVTSVEGAEISYVRTKEMVGESGMKYFMDMPAPSLYLIDLTSLLRNT